MDELPPTPRRNPGWMLTFADLLALILTFFVMLYAMNHARSEKWSGLAAVLQDHFSTGSGHPTDRPSPSGAAQLKDGMDLGYLQTVIEGQFGRAGLAYRIERRPDELLIHLPQAVEADADGFHLTKEAESAARELGQVLEAVRNGISVSGHAASGLPGTAYGSPWELSLASARLVAKGIEAAGYGRNILALGHGDAYLEPESGAGHGNAPMGQVDVVIRSVASGN
jgi:chemotaxis protein MotB